MGWLDNFDKLQGHVNRQSTARGIPLGGVPRQTSTTTATVEHTAPRVAAKSASGAWV